MLTYASHSSTCRASHAGRTSMAVQPAGHALICTRALRMRVHAAPEATPAAAAPTAPSQPARRRGHDAPAPSATSPPPDPAVLRLREHQSAAARQPFADECRTLIALSRYGVLSTLSVAPESEGYPSGSIVGYADEVATGAPIFAFSGMSSHTKDISKDGRASLTVTAPGFQGAADARVCITGRLVAIPEAEKEAAKARYLTVHPDAFWVTYGDFSFWRMTDLVAIRLIGGFARAGSVPPKLYAAAKPDPVAPLTHIVASANKHGPAAWVAALAAAVGADVGLEEAQVLSLDRLGLNLNGRRSEARGGGSMKLRLPFPAPADTEEAAQAQVQALLDAVRA